MAEPLTVAGAIERISQAHERWLDLTAPVPPEAWEQPGAFEQWSLKQVAAHLSFWQRRLMAFAEAASSGSRPAMPDEQLPDHFDRELMHRLNAEVAAAALMRPASMIRAELVAMHQAVLSALRSLTDADLSEPGRFAFLAGRPLADWVGGETWEHYAEHEEPVRRYILGLRPA